MTEDNLSVRVIGGYSMIRVALTEVTNAQGFVRGFNVVIHNLLAGKEMIDQSFLTGSPYDSPGPAYCSAYQWGLMLAGVLECDFSDLSQYWIYLDEEG